MNETRNLIERLRQIAESQRMDFDSPNVAATLDDAATTLETLSAIGSVAEHEPEWEYGEQSKFDPNTVWVIDPICQSMIWDDIPKGKRVRRRAAGPWVPVP